MRNILLQIRKEFTQIFRDRIMIRIVIVMPFIQLIIFINAANMVMNDIKVFVVDNDLTPSSKELINKFQGSPYFKIAGASFSTDDGYEALKRGECDIVLNIPHDFEKNIFRQQESDAQVLINAINSTAAGLINSYATSLIIDYNSSILPVTKLMPEHHLQKKVNVQYSYWFNPQLSYKIFFLPAMMTVLLTIIAMFLCSLNLVREKENGTIEQVNVTPIKKYQFVAGKLIPFWILALLEVPFELLIGKVFYNITYDGNIILLMFVSGLYLFSIMGIALYIASNSSTQQQAMFITFFFMLTFIMMSGLFTPTESMPEWAKWINTINPAAYFIKANRMILMKDSSILDILKEALFLSLFAITVLSVAIKSYKKVVV